MNSIDAMSRLAALTHKLGYDLTQYEQGSYEWLKARLGVMTASKAKFFLASPSSVGYQGYMAILIAEIATAAPVEGDNPKGKSLEWGNEHEPDAREMYEFMTGNAVSQYPIVYKDESMRSSCSPDGFIEALGRGVEIKCPYNTRYHIEFLVDGTIKKEYMAQVQYSMWVTGAKEWEFVSYDPRMNANMIKYVTVSRDEKYMKKFDEVVPKFIVEMDRKMKLIDLQFGDQWK